MKRDRCMIKSLAILLGGLLSILLMTGCTKTAKYNRPETPPIGSTTEEYVKAGVEYDEGLLVPELPDNFPAGNRITAQEENFVFRIDKRVDPNDEEKRVYSDPTYENPIYIDIFGNPRSKDRESNINALKDFIFRQDLAFDHYMRQETAGDQAPEGLSNWMGGKELEEWKPWWGKSPYGGTCERWDYEFNDANFTFSDNGNTAEVEYKGEYLLAGLGEDGRVKPMFTPTNMKEAGKRGLKFVIRERYQRDNAGRWRLVEELKKEQY